MKVAIHPWVRSMTPHTWTAEVTVEDPHIKGMGGWLDLSIHQYPDGLCKVAVAVTLRGNDHFEMKTMTAGSFTLGHALRAVRATRADKAGLDRVVTTMAAELRRRLSGGMPASRVAASGALR